MGGFAYKWVTQGGATARVKLASGLGPLNPDYVVTTLFTSNFIGIVFARTLHYQVSTLFPSKSHIHVLYIDRFTVLSLLPPYSSQLKRPPFSSLVSPLCCVLVCSSTAGTSTRCPTCSGSPRAFLWSPSWLWSWRSSGPSTSSPPHPPPPPCCRYSSRCNIAHKGAACDVC